MDRMVVVCYHIRCGTYIGQLSDAGNTPMVVPGEQVL